jgi:hypothetical protein
MLAVQQAALLKRRQGALQRTTRDIELTAKLLHRGQLDIRPPLRRHDEQRLRQLFGSV